MLFNNVICIPPRALNVGDRVAIVAPASPFRSDELLDGIDVIRECGLTPVLGPNVRMLHSHGTHAASVGSRVDELMWAFSDTSISAVITATGGVGSAAVLPYLDYDVIRTGRKALLGMSDITSLNTGIMTCAGLTSISGQYPTVRVDEGDKKRMSDTESLALTLELMMSREEWGERPFCINQYIPRTVSPGRASGHIVGGNLDTFSRLLGTEFFPDCNGAILFIEDVHKDGEGLQRMLIHMRLAGVLDQVAGVVIGEFYDVPKKEDARVPDIDDVILEFFSDGVPCLAGVSFSHGDFTIPIPIGAQCDMNATIGDVSFRFRMG